MSKITMHPLRTVAIAFAGMVVAGGAVLAQAEVPAYRIVDLGTFGSPGSDTFSTAYDLNERGHVVGAAQDDNGAARAFLYRNGKLIDVGAFNLEYHSASGTAVNDHGQVAGRSIGWSPYPKFPTWVQRPFLGTRGGAPIDAAAGIGIDGEAFGINDRAQMAVTLTRVPGFRSLNRAHFWDPETGLHEIEFPLQPEGDDAESAAWAINQHGQVAGAFVGEDLALHAYVWDPETNEVVDLHNPYVAGSGAYALNDRGDAAGWMEDFQLNHFSIVWAQDGRIVSIPATRPGLPSGTAEDINNLGDVVGWDSTAQDDNPLAWVAFDAVDGQFPNGYPESIALVDLLEESDEEEWELWYAYGINDARQVVGIGLHNGVIRGFLMSPDTVLECGFEGYPGFENQVAARAVLDLRGADGPLFPAREDYDRAARDLALIAAEHPHLDPGSGSWRSEPAGNDYTRRIRCVFENGIDRSEFDDLADCHEVETTDQIDGNTVVVEFPESANADLMAEILGEASSVEYCETMTEPHERGNSHGHHVARDFGDGWWLWEVRMTWGAAGSGRLDCDYVYGFYTHPDHDRIYDVSPRVVNPYSADSRPTSVDCGGPDLGKKF